MQPSAAIVAVSEMKPGRYPHYNGMEMYRQVLAQFLREWPQLRPSDIQGLMSAPAGMASAEGVDVFAHEKIAEELGIEPTFSETINAGGATYALMLIRASLAIERGLCDSVLCLGAGRFPNVGSGMAETMSKLISHPEFEYPYGTYIPPIFALNATRHMHEFGTTREQLAQVAVSQRAWSLLHPDALMAPQGPLTVDKVLSSRPIAYPFNLLDCSVPCEGGSAVLLVSARLATRYAKQPCYLLGYGEKHTHSSISQAHDLTTLGSKETGAKAYRMAGVGPADMDFAQLYDSFSINPIIYAEDLGLCAKGQGGAFFAGGRTAPGGEFPVNTYGGLMSFGHVGDASGQTMIVEAARQIMGIAGPQRQLAKAGLGVVHCYGGMMAEHATLVLGRQS